MNCFYHPDRQAVGSCTTCGQPICNVCLNKLAGKYLCDTCAKQTPVSSMDADNLISILRKAFGERCYKCDGAISPDFKVCPRCGTQLILTCPHCNKQVNPQWSTCPYCTEPIVKQK